MTSVDRAAPVTETCSDCHIVGGHSMSCPTRLATYEGRVKYAAHIYTFPYSLDCWQRCKALGISSDEFEAGVRLREKQEAEYRSWTAQYGSQEYGGWIRSPRDGRYKPHQVVEAETAEDTQIPCEKELSPVG